MAAPSTINIIIIAIFLVAVPSVMGREVPGEEWTHVMVNQPMLEAIEDIISSNSQSFVKGKAKYFFTSSEQPSKKNHEFSFLKDFDPWSEVSIYHGDSSLEANQEKPVEPDAVIVLHD